MNFIKHVVALFMLVTLAACGGGGGEAGTPVTGTGSTTGSTTGTTVATTTGTTAGVTTTPLFTTAPPSLTLQNGTSSSPYTVGGGVAPYLANSDDPALVEPTITGSTLVIKAKNSGTASVVVIDAVGTKQTIPVKVPEPEVLFTDLQSLSDLSIGTTNFTTIYGGTPFTGAASTYVVNNSNPAVVKTVLTGNTLAITGLSTGSATIAISDTKGKLTTISVTVPTPSALYTDAPSTLTIASGTANIFTVFGGTTPYSVNNGNPAIVSASVSGAALTLSGLSTGTASLVISDAKGATNTIVVTVPAPGALFTTAPSNLIITRGTTNDFAISGGTKPYKVANNAPTIVGVVDIPAAGSTLSVKGLSSGTASLFVSDAKGATLTVAVTVPAPVTLFTTAPATLTMPATLGTALSFGIAGGDPGYTVTSSNPAVVGVNAVDGTPYTLTSIAGGSATIEIRDTKGAVVNVAVTVPFGPALFSDAPANLTVAASAPGNTYTVNLSGGTKPYTAVSSNAGVVTAAAAVPAVDGKFVLTGISAGAAAITFKDSTGSTITASVTVAAPTALFSTAPATLGILGGSTYYYQVFGGTAPYAVNDSGVGVIARAVLTAVAGTTTPNDRLAITGLAPGKQTVAISDAKGAVITIDVTVNQGLFTDAPASLTLAGGTGSNTFSVFGGVPFTGRTANYNVNSSNVTVASASILGSTLTISGLSIGTSTLTISDSAGASTTITVTVPAFGALLSTAPANLTLAIGTSSSTFAMTSGVAPYTPVSSNPALVTVSLPDAVNAPSSLKITAQPATNGGTANVTVTDVKGAQLTIAVTVPAPAALFTTAPATLTMPNPSPASGASLTFAIAGGVPDYTVTSSNTAVVSVTPPAAGGSAYTLTSVAGGTATIMIRDKSTNSATVSVVATVPASALFIDAPANVTVGTAVPGNTYSVTISGGTKPYTAMSSNAAVATASVPSATGTFDIKGVSAGSTAITIKDATGTTITVSVTVQALFSTAPATLGILSGTTNYYQVFGGTAPYTVNDSSSGVVARVELSAGTETPTLKDRLAITGLVPGKQTVAISDAKGAVITIDVTVNQGLFTDAPASLTLAGGTGNTFTVYGGVPFPAVKPYYKVNSSNTSVASAVFDGASLTISGLSVGSTTLTLSDSVGATTTITVTVPAVGALLSTAPANLTLSNLALNNTFSIVMTSGVTPYTPVSSNAALVTVSVPDPVKAPTSMTITALPATNGGTANVTVTDAKGAQLTIAVTVPAPAALFTTAPAKLAIAAGTPVKSFAVLGGSGTYTAVNTHPDIATGVINGTTLDITGKIPGTGSVIVSDSAGKTITVDVVVNAQGPLYLSAPACSNSGVGQSAPACGSTVYIPPGSSDIFNIIGGIPPYTSSSDNLAVGKGTIVNANQLKVESFLSTALPTTAQISVTDAAGTQINLTLVPQLQVLSTTAPANLAMAIGGSGNSYKVSGGVAAYTAVSNNETVATVTPPAADGTFTIKGISTGTATVTLKDAAGTTIPVSVTVLATKVLFTDTPANLTLATGATYFTNIFNGTGPYTVNSSNPSVVTTPTGSLGPDTYFTMVAKSVGNATVAISDANGTLTTIAVTVTNGVFTDAPANLTLANGTGSNTFTIFGGTPFAAVAPSTVPTYHIASSNTAIATTSTNNGSSFTIMGVASGATTMVITDSLGVSATVNVTVAVPGALLTTAPPTLTLVMGSPSQSYSITGGIALATSPNYTTVSSHPTLVTAATATNAGATTLTLTALPNTSGGTANVVVTDAKGTSVTIAVTVPAPTALFTTAPATLTMLVPTPAGASLTFAIAGGVPNYTVTSSNLAVVDVLPPAAGGTAFTLTSHASGTATIEIRDSKGATVSVAVTVTSATALFVDAPPNVMVGTEATYPVNVTGGVGTYTAVSSNVAVVTLDKATATDGKFVMMGASVGTAAVTFKDATGTTITVSVTVTKSLLTDSPANLTLAVGSTNFTSIYGGTAPYSVSSSNAAVVSTPTGSLGAGITKFSIVAKSVGTATVAISDANGNGVTILVTVPAPAGLFTDAPANLTLVSGTGNTFTVFGGVPFLAVKPYYKVNSSNATVASAVFDGTSLAISGISIGSTTLTINDSVGATTTITVTVPAVGALLSTAPANLTLASGAIGTFAMTSGTPTYLVASANPSLVTALVTPPVAPATATTLTITAAAATNGGTANVTVTDAKGAQLTIAVTVPTPTVFFTTAPATLAIASGAPMTFALLGGTESYLAAVNNNTAVATGVVNAKTLTITGNATGTTTVSVSDTAGATVTIQVNVTAPGVMTVVAPTTVTIAAGTSDTYDIKAGVPGYVATSSNLAVAKPTIVGATQVKIEGVATGNALVIVTDQAGSTVTIAVTVPAPSILFTTAPTGGVYLANTGTASYAIYGSSLAYTAMSSNTSVVTANVTAVPYMLNLQAVAGGTAIVFVSDTAGNTVIINVTVGSANTFFVTAPNALNMGSNTSSASPYQVSGGAKPYNASSSDNRVVTASVDPVTSILTINAWNTGTATLKVSDALGANYAISIVVDSATGAAAPAAIEILASSNTLNSAPGSLVGFIVTVKDQANTAVPSRTVVFSADSGTITGANPSPTTDAAGTITTVSLSPGTNAANRDIVLTATTAGVSKTITIPVVGTKVSISGAGAALVGSAPQNYTVKAVDSSGKPIVGAVLTITSAKGNGLNPATVTTDNSGAATTAFTALLAGIGDDTLTVTGQGATGTAVVTVSNVNFSFTTTPATALLWPVSTRNAVIVHYTPIPPIGTIVTFGTTRGTLSDVLGVPAVTASTDLNGDATIYVSSATAGPVTVSAQLGTARTSLTGAFNATVPAGVVLQANPAAVLPNAVGSTTNQSALTALVRDAVGNPVQGVVVNFTAFADASNGTISPGSVTTDVNGLATAQFIAGALSTPANGVKIDASLPAYPAIATSRAQLTVSGEALFISMGRSSTLIVYDPATNTTYQKDFTVYVTDANGAPAGNRAVTLSVDPVSYGKGTLSWNIVDKVWVYTPPANLDSPKLCVNEDTNRNGVLDPFEDINNNGTLQPGLPATITPTVTTDTNGFATFSLRFAKSYAWWVRVQITARSLVGGTESTQTQTYDLEMSSEDAHNAGNPANSQSPFGTAAVCPDPL